MDSFVNHQKQFPPLRVSANGRKLYGISGIAKPGSKAVMRKNHKAWIISWTGRASRSFSENRGILM
jgi:hypothetical protein